MSQRDGGPLVSLVICTHNRAALLDGALQTAIAAMARNVPCELIVVDNASTDGTKDLVAACTHPSVRYFHELRPGLSHARNAGWQMARAPFVGYIDDDAELMPGWFEAVVDGFADHPRAGALGGPAWPIWQAPRPDWLDDEVANALSILDLGPAAHRLDLGLEWLVGANIAFRKNALAGAGQFDPRLGRRSGLLISNEDSLLLTELDRSGHEVWYRPAMQVRHTVPADRLEPGWLLKRHFWQGVSDAIVAVITDNLTQDERLAQAETLAAQMSTPGCLADIARTDARFTERCSAARQAGRIAHLLANPVG